LAQFRADRATAVSDIIVRVAAEDLRQKAAAGAHGMSVYVWSAFLHRANIALNVYEFLLYAFPATTAGTCGDSAADLRPRGFQTAYRAPTAAEVNSLQYYF